MKNNRNVRELCEHVYVLILSTVHQIDAPKINFFTQSHKKNNRAQALFAVTEDSEGFLLEISL